MTKKLARLLRADIQETSDLKSIAKMLANKGRGKDTILAHITPKEAEILKEAGGSGTTNPDTGLLEFEGGFEGYGDYEPAQSAMNVASQQWQPPAEAPAIQETPVEAAPVAPIQDYSGSSIPSYYKENAPVPLEFNQGQISTIPSATAAAAPTVSARGVEGFGAAVPATYGTTGAQDITPPSLTQRAGDVLSAIKAGGSDILDYLNKHPELAKLGISGAGALLTARQAKQGAQQVQEATTQQKALASPYQKQGAEAQRAALAGELTPQGTQALQAARAQLAQGVEQRGGVGVAQAQAQLENLRQNLLQQQLDYGIKLSSIGDNIAIGAIRTGLQADQAVNQLTNSMYSNMFAIASGLSPQQIRTQATQGGVSG